MDGNGFCRLCRKQATLERSRHRKVDVLAANRHGQQLFLADMFHRLGTTRRPAAVATALAPIRPVTHRQEVLFPAQRNLRRDGLAKAGAYRVVGTDLAVALDAVVEQRAARHGWSHSQRKKVREGIHVLLALQDTLGAAITTTEAGQLTGTSLPVRSICEVLAEAGMLVDDKEPALRRWFRERIADLPATMRNEVTTWFTILEQGSTTSPRRRPRAETTIRLAITWVLPALTTWAAKGRQHLREISHDDVLAVLPEQGSARAEQVQGLRSLFSTLKHRKVIFTNPTARISISKPVEGPPLPMDVNLIRKALDDPDPARALLVGLLAFHGLRPIQLRHLMLTDVRDGRLHTEGRTILMASEVCDRLAAWLAYRNGRWPNTANPFLFLNFRNATHTTPVGLRWIFLKIDLPGSARAVRTDRILHEAHATRGDARRLSDLFGLGVKAATRYTNTVDPPEHTDGDRQRQTR